MSKTYVIGVGMTKFDKPGTKEGDYPDWAKEAGEKALVKESEARETAETTRLAFREAQDAAYERLRRSDPTSG